MKFSAAVLMPSAPENLLELHIATKVEIDRRFS